MTEQNNEYIDKHFAELHEFLSGQFGKICERFERVDNEFVSLRREIASVPTELREAITSVRQAMHAVCSELHLKLNFICKELESINRFRPCSA